MTKAPIARSISWFGVAVGMVPLLLVLWLNAWLAPQWYPFAGALGWLGFILLTRQFFTGAHRKGIRLVKSGRFEEAIPFFAESYESMHRRPWIDKCRWIIFGSSSRWSYREMALCNQAFCHGQAGDGQKMRACYGKALTEFPESVLATTALRMLDSVTPK